MLRFCILGGMEDVVRLRLQTFLLAWICFVALPSLGICTQILNSTTTSVSAPTPSSKLLRSQPATVTASIDDDRFATSTGKRPSPDAVALSTRVALVQPSGLPAAFAEGIRPWALDSVFRAFAARAPPTS